MKVNINQSDKSESINGEEKQVTCKGCHKILGSLFISEKPSAPIKRKFVCPCGESSFVIKSDKVAFFIPSEKLNYESFKVDDGVNIAIMKEKV